MQHVFFLVFTPALFWSNKEAAVLQDREEPVGSPSSAQRSHAHSAPGTDDYTGRTSEPGLRNPVRLDRAQHEFIFLLVMIQSETAISLTVFSHARLI